MRSMRRPTSRTAIHAIMRVMWQSCGLIIIEPPWFCSATPCLETRARASRGVYGRLTLNQRANPLARIPEVEVVDFRDYIGQQEASNFTLS